MELPKDPALVGPDLGPYARQGHRSLPHHVYGQVEEPAQGVQEGQAVGSCRLREDVVLQGD
ncbi:plastid developmental protein DAG [Actinidia rufa]|uniref:Plastid developmental protein DAG n=1 Tax=Actinidia rufa TaxID=165716 RepID=A0A7J0D8S4_9ERIC|nr:plastid developmental protein DAG [Actinidia rufa]